MSLFNSAISAGIEAKYGEFTAYDLREAIEKVDSATELFMEVPSEIRGKFENDAGAFIDYATNPMNIDQLRDWGLANPPERAFKDGDTPLSAGDKKVPEKTPDELKKEAQQTT